MKIVTHTNGIDFAFQRVRELRLDGRTDDAEYLLTYLQTMAAYASVHSHHNSIPFRGDEPEDEFRVKFDEAVGLTARTDRPNIMEVRPASEKPTATFLFWGESDDCIEVDGAVREEFSQYNSMWTATITAPDGKQKMLISGWYADNGCWNFAIGQVDEETPLPKWPTSISQRHDRGEHYSTLLEVTAPAGSTLTPSKSE
ncbi:hypothetical protein [Rhodococcus sp. (in: high G+C Gram-positive bacteria)]|uniref:hypothetical protein n=1 Tax=Rhodococcus sp. TaxID=1831 RepID=UPI00257EC726|nr:hypothetical protein [Rhodococcus sp. (in: high G+C Gram-positive bacteria)]MBQ7808140.1 hypothetical protein [Rhodococcus sp. (in: high G+C Gram-positive bacteria)]